MGASFDEFCARTGLRRSLLVVAPHPDDETIGCGGAIALAVRSGMRVSVVLVTDGAASHPGSATWTPERIAERRRVETVRALQVLGVDTAPEFLGLPDAHTGTLSAARTVAARKQLAGWIAQHQPDVVLTTWRREPHGDHRFSYALTRDAMQEAETGALPVEYLVWTNLAGTPDDHPRPDETLSFRLDVQEVRVVKRRALAAHRSQLGRLIRDDPDGFSLNRVQLQSMTRGDELYELPLAR